MRTPKITSARRNGELLFGTTTASVGLKTPASHCSKFGLEAMEIGPLELTTALTLRVQTFKLALTSVVSPPISESFTTDPTPPILPVVTGYILLAHSWRCGGLSPIR